MKIEDETSSA